MQPRQNPRLNSNQSESPKIFASLIFAACLTSLSACSTSELERHAENPNDPHAEASDSDKCCLEWEGSTCVKERKPGCADRLAKEAIQHGLDFPSPATVAPAAGTSTPVGTASGSPAGTSVAPTSR